MSLQQPDFITQPIITAKGATVARIGRPRLADWCSVEGCPRVHYARGKCRLHYQRDYRQQGKCRTAGCRANDAGHGRCRPHERDALAAMRPQTVTRALDRLAETAVPDWNSGCWIATETDGAGYGVIRTGRQWWYAHRLTYVWFYGGHGHRLELDHICNTSTCARPDHLWPITPTQNRKLRDQRAYAGPLEWWRDTAGIPVPTPLASWAIGKGLPIGKLPPFNAATIAEAQPINPPPTLANLQDKRITRWVEDPPAIAA